MGTLTNAFLCLVAYHVVSRLVGLKKLLDATGHHPGPIRMTSTYGAILYLCPWRIPYLTVGNNYVFDRKYGDYAQYGVDVTAQLSTHPLRTVFHVADPAVIKEMCASRARWPKPVEVYKALSLYGPNIVASEHDAWKRYRRICAPSFSERNNRLVWDETVRIVTELFDEVWGAKDEVVVEDVLPTTLAITLFIISVAGFGQRISWKGDDARPEGCEMTFKQVIHHVSTGVFTKLATPAWLLKLGLTKRMRDTRVAFDELAIYMADFIKQRRESEIKEERCDLLSNLLDASDAEGDGELKLADEELAGNIFIFLIAGHETTGHTLTYALALLALYPDEQEKLFQHVKTLLPKDGIPRFEDVNKYTYAQAVFYETLRLYPAVTTIPKRAAEDSVLRTRNAADEPVAVHIPKGSEIVLDTAGLHYNPHYWSDPHAFAPARFLEKDWPRDAFLPFSGGARACLGRRFAEVEAIAVLVMFVSRYTIHLRDNGAHPRGAPETLLQKRERVLRSQMGLTLTPMGVPLVFKRR